MRTAFLVATVLASTTFFHCAAPDDDEAREATGSQSAAAVCAAQWNPSWQEGPGTNEWWVEYAIAGGTVSAASLDVPGLGQVPLSLQWGKWAGSSAFRIPRGTSVVLRATSAAGQQAKTEPFAYTTLKKPLTASDNCEQCPAVTWRQTTYANNWWVEYGIAGAPVNSASLEIVGPPGRTVPLALTYGKWIGSTGTSSIATGTPVILRITNGGQTVRTKTFRYLLDAEPVTDCAVPGQGAVRFVGRRDSSDPMRPKFGWPGARIIAKFTGSAVSATLAEEPLQGGPSRWEIIVDGAPTRTLVPTNGTASYVLATGLANTTHTIELYRRTEGLVGTTQFLGYTFPGGQLLPPDAASSRRIEFLGDSSTTGYGNECTDPSGGFSGATSNERLAYPGLVAREMGADHHNVSFGGKGVLYNYGRTDPVVFDQLFTRAMPQTTTPLWDFTTFAPEVVWMTIGGNDWSQPSPTTPPTDLTTYTNKYLALVTLIRSKYPNAHLFCAISPSQNDYYPAGWNALTNQRAAVTSVVQSRQVTGDGRIYKYEFARATAADLTGCDYHANLGLHRRMANEVIAQVKAKTGW